MHNRLEQLDSIRGLAALFVLFNHLLLIFPSLAGETSGNKFVTFIFKDTPLHLFWGGHESVLTFFILSGFVLSLAYYKNNPISYSQYIIKRIWRLYAPYIVVIAAAIFLNHYFYTKEPLINLSEWINKQWADVTWNEVFGHLLALGNFDIHVLNPPVWSLVHEMRISIVFPIIMYFILKYSLKTAITMALAFSVIGFGLSKFTNPSNIDYFITIHYSAFFIVGALLAKNKIIVTNLLKKINSLVTGLLLALSILLLTYQYWFLPKINFIHMTIINDWVAALGSLIFISISLSSPKLIRVLSTKPLLFLGKISYSFYLYHFIILLTALYTLHGYMDTWAICLISVIVTFVVASIMYLLVEKPSIKVGGKISAYMKQKGIEKNVDVA